jgi:hypothetical protein
MACRPKEERLQDEQATPSSKIFKSLQESDAGKSFRGSSGPGPSPKKTPSNVADEGEQPRSIRANAAMRLRESLDPTRTASSTKLPRAPAPGDKKKGNGRYDSDESEDFESTRATDENREPRPDGMKNLARKSALIAQLESASNRNPQSAESSRQSKGIPQQPLSARFKSTSHKSQTIDSDGDLEDDHANNSKA